jgi:hypothetical protein
MGMARAQTVCSSRPGIPVSHASTPVSLGETRPDFEVRLQPAGRSAMTTPSHVLRGLVAALVLEGPGTCSATMEAIPCSTGWRRFGTVCLTLLV